MQHVTQYRCRETGKLCQETVFGEKGLSLLYGNPIGRFFANVLLRTHLPSRAYGWLQSRPSSRKKIRSFIEKLGVDSDAADRPIDSYPDLNSFFTRKLRQDLRPIDSQENSLLSPADGRITVYPSHAENGTIQVKSSTIPLQELLRDNELTAQFCDGSVVVVRLAPADCHRFHFPDSGLASPTHTIGWGLHSVHPIALESGAQSFLNRRMISTLESTHFGRIVLIEVGAMLVGQIDQTYIPGLVGRGTEKGFFSFGGSTVIVLAQKDRIVFDEDLIEASKNGIETLVKYGTRIGGPPQPQCAT